MQTTKKRNNRPDYEKALIPDRPRVRITTGEFTFTGFLQLAEAKQLIAVLTDNALHGKMIDSILSLDR